jgi:hypothetical protein
VKKYIYPPFDRFFQKWGVFFTEKIITTEKEWGLFTDKKNPEKKNN